MALSLGLIFVLFQLGDIIFRIFRRVNFNLASQEEREEMIKNNEAPKPAPIARFFLTALWLAFMATLVLENFKK